MVNKMSWKDTIRKKGTRSMSTHAIGLIEYVLTSEPQSPVANRPRKQPQTSHRQRIPTINELKYWLARQPHIESARFDKWTNKRIRNPKGKHSRSVLKYWRP